MTYDLSHTDTTLDILNVRFELAQLTARRALSHVSKYELRSGDGPALRTYRQAVASMTYLLSSDALVVAL